MNKLNGHHKGKKLNRLAWLVSVVVFLLILMMRRYKIDTEIDFSWLPPLYSLLNTLTFLLLLAGLYFIRVKKNQKVHQTLMIPPWYFLPSF